MQAGPETSPIIIMIIDCRQREKNKNMPVDSRFCLQRKIPVMSRLESSFERTSQSTTVLLISGSKKMWLLENMVPK